MQSSKEEASQKQGERDILRRFAEQDRAGQVRAALTWTFEHQTTENLAKCPQYYILL